MIDERAGTRYDKRNQAAIERQNEKDVQTRVSAEWSVK